MTGVSDWVSVLLSQNSKNLKSPKSYPKAKELAAMEGKNDRILITGATGFVGGSILDELTLNGLQELITGSSRQTAPTAAVHHVVWDMNEEATFACDWGKIIHCASPASALLTAQSPLLVFNQIVKSTENLVRFLESASVPPRVLFTSSGAVYGGSSDGSTPISESSRQAIHVRSANAAYGEGKRVAEFLLGEAASRGLCEVVVARLFSFSGSRLPLSKHFALGNFVRDALTKDRITVRGDGAAIRSYMDQKDMAQWLLRVLESDEALQPFHIGSNVPISIAQLAQLVSERCTHVFSKTVDVEILGEISGYDGFDVYVPDTTWTQSVLGVGMEIPLAESIDEMLLTWSTALGKL